MNDPRPDKLRRVMIELETMSQWVTCQRGRVGSALVDSDRVILVPARNGTPHNMPSCKEMGADPTVKCTRCIHSEKNVINLAAKNGVRTEGKDLVTLCRPCVDCAGDIVQAGIAAVYYRWDYFTDEPLGGLDYVKSMFAERVLLFQLKMTPQEESFHKMIEEWRKTWCS